MNLLIMSLINNNVIDGNTKSFISLNIFHLYDIHEEDKLMWKTMFGILMQL
jgi:hypothetical protein